MRETESIKSKREIETETETETDIHTFTPFRRESDTHINRNTQREISLHLADY